MDLDKISSSDLILREIWKKIWVLGIINEYGEKLKIGGGGMPLGWKTFLRFNMKLMHEKTEKSKIFPGNAYF